MKSAILGAVIGALLVHLFSPVETVENVVYKEGRTDTLTIIDTVTHIDTVPIPVIRWKTRIIKGITHDIAVSSYKDSSEHHNLAIEAYAPLPVDSFRIDLKIKEKIVEIHRVDTIQITTNIPDGNLGETGEYAGALIFFILGSIL